jgi:hypothetical protein
MGFDLQSERAMSHDIENPTIYHFIINTTFTSYIPTSPLVSLLSSSKPNPQK